MAISLEAILDPAVLKRVWKDVRGRERQVHLKDAPLVRDSTAGVAFDLNLKDALNYLRVRILDGTYRPHPPVTVEVAKSNLLRRRLSFLAMEDAIVLGGLVQSARPSLMAKMSEWVSFGRADEDGQPTEAQKRKKKITTFDYEGWWVKWLRYRKLLSVIEDDPNPFLVVSDVVNFFGSVDLSLLRSKVSGTTSLDNQAIDLLFYILDRLRPAESYGPRGSLGLPVVADDTSRVLAHFYLNDLDQELLPEGQQNRYTRWVDDMAVSVTDRITGGKVVARVERALSRIGLVANSSKTSIVSKDDFRRYHYEVHNQYLDQIHEVAEQPGKLSEEARHQFELWLSEFLGMKREGYWTRVLRRYYTQSRRIRSNTLLGIWDAHLTELPSEGESILDYVAFSSGTLELCQRMFGYLKSNGPLFENLQILIYEALLLTPFQDDPALRRFIVDQTHQHLLAENGFDRPTGYVRGLQALTIYKFGGAQAVGRLEQRFGKQAAAESPIFATYAFPVVAASDIHRAKAFQAVEHIEDSRILRIRTLVERLERGEHDATGMLLGFLEPKTTKFPTRAVVNPRALPLLKISLRSQDLGSLKRVRSSMVRVSEKMKNTGDPDLVDWVTLSHLKVP